MKTKAILLSLLIAGGTATAFAFSSGEEANKVKRDPISRTFYHDGNFYVQTQPDGLCSDDDGYCTITFTGEAGNLPVGTFAENAIPTGSFTIAYGDALKSWQ